MKHAFLAYEVTCLKALKVTLDLSQKIYINLYPLDLTNENDWL